MTARDGQFQAADSILESLRPESGLSATARRIARFIHENRALSIACSAADLAQRLDTSDATVIRSIQAMGFEGLADLRATLIASLNDATTPASALRRTINAVGDDLAPAIDAILRVQEESVAALREPVTRHRIAQAVSTLHDRGRIAVFANGPSAALADYVARMLDRHGLTSLCISGTGQGFADELLRLRAGDGLIVLAYSRVYREIDVMFRHAARLGLPIILVTDEITPEAVPPEAVIVSARRGRQGHVALHAAILGALEAIVTALAVVRRDSTIASLDRLGQLREELQGPA